MLAAGWCTKWGDEGPAWGIAAFLLCRDQCSCSGCRRRALCVAPVPYFRDERFSFCCSAILPSLPSVLTLLLAQAGLHSCLSWAPSASGPAFTCFGRAARTARIRMEPLPVQGDFLNALSLHQESLNIFERNASNATEHVCLLNLFKV